ncbi:hypothetical protein MPLDJ20_150410 [Mesorhizobium plurifarium]|uniref:Uncharacterized protein n=1 Tax=Mesorhizobium plurifarium TaxID=69974 RepID=A0A090EV56_MESPL|nr:hypothetical protein MPLDJ20_150410 [Mesorhizobium plurifarium]
MTTACEGCQHHKYSKHVIRSQMREKMQSAEPFTSHPLLEFEGLSPRSGRLGRTFAALCTAPACAQAKGGYIISHQNRGCR